MERSVDAMTTPVRDDPAVSRLGMPLNGVAELLYQCPWLDKLYCLVQAFPGRFNYSDRVRVCLGSIAHIIRFVDIGVISLVV